jgi:hypothetical protein
MDYYFVLSALPPLSLDKPAEITFHELKEMLELNLTFADLKKVESLLRPIDLSNIRAFWLGVPLDERGNLNEVDLEEALLIQDPLPDYLIDYLERYESVEDRLKHFTSLYVSFYAHEKPGLTGLGLELHRLEREIRLHLTALRAKETGRDLVRELQFEDPSDPIVAEILAQKDSPTYTPPKGFEDLKTLFLENSFDPNALNRAILEYRFKRIEDLEEPSDFGIDRILSYVARLILVESLRGNDPDQGKTEVKKLSQYG